MLGRMLPNVTQEGACCSAWELLLKSILRLSTISILHNATKGDDKVIVAECSYSQVDTLKTNYFFNICITFYNTEQMSCKQFAQSFN